MNAQLKVENPVPLRTIGNFQLLPRLRASYCCGATVIYPEALIKNQLKIKTRRYSTGGHTDIARKKSTQPQHWREGFHGREPYRRHIVSGHQACEACP